MSKKPSRFVAAPKEQYKQLLEGDLGLTTLEQAGVDNWEGNGSAMGVSEKTSRRRHIRSVFMLTKILLGLTHLTAAFGATVLVPMLTGFNPAIALLGAGIGTLIFHWMTGKKIPVFLGSSFAFIAIMQTTVATLGPAYAAGGVVTVGLMYVLYAFTIGRMKPSTIKRIFSPVITGTMIIVIGMTLAPTIINNNIIGADGGTLALRWIVALVSLAVTVLFNNYAKGLMKQTSILFGIGAGYILSALLGLVDFTPILNASWFAIPQFVFPKFNLGVMISFAAISAVVILEHLGDILAVGNVVGKDYVKDVGYKKTILGDGLATLFAGLIGAPVNTTYSENAGVLALTKNFDPLIIRIAAAFAILIAFCGKLTAFLGTIPAFVIGGISIMLFGSIAAVGIKTLVNDRVDLSSTRNLTIVAIMLVFGLSGVAIGPISGMALAAILGIALNLLLPKEENKKGFIIKDQNGTVLKMDASGSIVEMRTGDNGVVVTTKSRSE